MAISEILAESLHSNVSFIFNLDQIHFDSNHKAHQ